MNRILHLLFEKQGCTINEVVLGESALSSLVRLAICQEKQISLSFLLISDFLMSDTKMALILIDVFADISQQP